MIDIGGGTTDIAIFTEGAIRYTSVIPIAGDHVTNDVAVAMRTPTQYAEQIKIEHASVLSESVDSEETIQVPSVAKRPPRRIQKKAVARVVEARYRELFELVAAELRRAGFDQLVAAGIVLTGGASNVTGCIELAESIFHMPVRLGLPQCVKGLVDVRDNPVYATGVGLLIHGHRNQLNGTAAFNLEESTMSLWQRMRKWFRGNF